ncbi:MAG: M12 family metallopeptidase [Deltaproteobacteria bacterium]
MLRYYFFDDPERDYSTLEVAGQTRKQTWVGSNDQVAVVERAFASWADLNLGIEFQRVHSRDEAELRIGFMQGDGAWSYVGRDALERPRNERTMNFGWNLIDDLDTALHEIGHALGMSHEHQNPNSGIEWDEEAVYSALARPPNEWSRGTTYRNIIQKLSPSEVRGSNWDPDSIMHYPFEAGLIRRPTKYADGLWPSGGLSGKDREWVAKFYPPSEPQVETLERLESKRVTLREAGQVEFEVVPEASRVHTFTTLGNADTVMVLFEVTEQGLVKIDADDDSGTDRNASFSVRLVKGRTYRLRSRLYWSKESGEFGIVHW